MMWQTRRITMLEIVLLAAGSALLLAVPVVLYTPATINPLVNRLSPMMSTWAQWLIFGQTMPLGLALVTIPLMRRLEWRWRRGRVTAIYLMACVLWLMVMPGEWRHSSKIGAVLGGVVGAVLLLVPRTRSGSATSGFSVVTEPLPDSRHSRP
jgi:hypothetical protein